MYQEMRDRLLETYGRETGELQKFHAEAVERAKKENRNNGTLLADDQQEWDRRSASLDEIQNNLKAIKDRIEGEKQIDEFRGNAERILATPEQPADDWQAQEKRIYDFFTRAPGSGESLDISFRGLDVNNFENGQRIVRESRTLAPLGAESRTGLVDGTTTAGGFTYGPSFRSVLYQHLVFHSAIRQTKATILTTNSGENLLLPKTTTHPLSGTIVAEAAAIGETDPVFGQATLGAYKYANIVTVSQELESDTQVDLLGYLASIMGRRLGDGMGAHFVTGTGSSQPQGVLVGAGTIAQITGGTPASSGATFGELTQVYDNVIPGYQIRGEWFLGQPAMQKIRALTNSQGTPIFLPNLSGDSPDMLFGHPITLDPNMPSPASNATSIAFGDFSTYFIRDVAGLRFERTTDRYFDTDQIGYKATWRTDGRLLDTTGAIAVYKGGTA